MLLKVLTPVIVTEVPPALDPDVGATDANAELWDFSGFSPYADEAVPLPGDTHSEMRWYWEAGHFKKSLGDRLLVHGKCPPRLPDGTVD